MFGFSLAEVAVILTVALIVLGPDKLPKVARTLAKVYGHLGRFKAEFTKTIEENMVPLDTSKWPEDRSDRAAGPQAPAGPETPQDQALSEPNDHMANLYPHLAPGPPKAPGDPDQDPDSDPDSQKS
ncbi:MAG: twin-arginine translocase TatA/TatE family subunit, partial [Deltaproteobacteria bacterium]|nr:twin-arginine translocase TatA/TatE family subunit [Deltaproteobacteria bacterium]